MRIHLDTDFAGDPDDACALASLLAARAADPSIEITGITTVADTDGRRAGYVHRLLDIAGVPRGAIPVAAGAGWSLTGGAEMGEIPDHDEFWGGPPVEPTPVDPAAAVALLDHSVRLGSAICTIGPLTNLGLLAAARPGRLADTAPGGHGGLGTRAEPGLSAVDRGPRLQRRLRPDVGRDRVRRRR